MHIYLFINSFQDIIVNDASDFGGDYLEDMEEERLEDEDLEVPLKSFTVERLKPEQEDLFYSPTIKSGIYSDAPVDMINEEFNMKEEKLGDDSMFVEQMITDGDATGDIFLKDETKNKIILKIFDCPFCKKVNNYYISYQQ